MSRKSSLDAPSEADSEKVNRHWKTQGERGNMFVLRLITWIALHLGRRITRCILVPVVAYFFISSPHARAASAKFLSRIPRQEHGMRAVFQHLYVFATVTLDRIYFLNGRLDLFDIEIKDENNIALGAAASGAGLFLMGAHFGSFESVRSIARDYPALKMVLLMYEENARNIKQLLHAINPNVQQEIISLGQPRAMLQVKEKINEGTLIGILADRSLDDTGCMRVNFLGSEAGFPTGPFRLAAMLQHPVYFMTGVFEGGNRYSVHLEPIADFSIPVENKESAVNQAMLRYVELLEKHCNSSPYNWFNYFDFWQEKMALA
jgi:predicted LPLAT superfamily acyltransferase